MQNPVEC